MGKLYLRVLPNSFLDEAVMTSPALLAPLPLALGLSPVEPNQIANMCLRNPAPKNWLQEIKQSPWTAFRQSLPSPMDLVHSVNFQPGLSMYS
jgi:hypothetical protein